MKHPDELYAEKIAEEYSQKSTSKVMALKKLDRKAKQPAKIFSLIFGIVGALVLGVGMCLAMGEIGFDSPASMAVGIIVGIIGIAMVSVDYPIYKKMLANGKKKYSFEILELAKEIADSQK